VILLLLFYNPANSQDSKERLRLIHADLLRMEQAGEDVKQVIEGNVKFQQGETTILCDMATRLNEQNIYGLFGDVHIYDSKQSLTADTVFVFESEKRQVATGNVRSIGEKDTTTADRMTYFEKENRVVSEGDVRVHNFKDRTIVTGGHAEYFRSDDYGIVTIEPIFIAMDSLGNETSRIIADTMKIYDDGDRMIADSDVKITRDNLTATCGRTEYSKSGETIVLTTYPEIDIKSQHITGDTVNLFLDNSRLSSAEVRGNATATADADSLAKGRWVNKLSGKLMTFYLVDEKVERVVIEKQATSVYHIIQDNEYRGANEVSGDHITIEISDDKAQKVSVKSDPDVAMGKFVPPKE
jgi:lipopolysaccharide export system protein LptA